MGTSYHDDTGDFGGGFVTGIGFGFCDGSESGFTGTGNKQAPFSTSSDDPIVQVVVGSSAVVDALQFVTLSGARSPVYGDPNALSYANPTIDLGVGLSGALMVKVPEYDVVGQQESCDWVDDYGYYCRWVLTYDTHYTVVAINFMYSCLATPSPTSSPTPSPTSLPTAPTSAPTPSPTSMPTASPTGPTPAPTPFIPYVPPNEGVCRTKLYGGRMTTTFATPIDNLVCKVEVGTYGYNAYYGERIEYVGCLRLVFCDSSESDYIGQCNGGGYYYDFTHLYTFKTVWTDPIVQVVGSSGDWIDGLQVICLLVDMV